MSEQLGRARCIHCGGEIEFDLANFEPDTVVDCPHCQKPTVLRLAAKAAKVTRNFSQPPGVTTVALCPARTKIKLWLKIVTAVVLSSIVISLIAVKIIMADRGSFERKDFRQKVAALKVACEGSTYEEFRAAELALESCYESCKANIGPVQIESNYSTVRSLAENIDRTWRAPPGEIVPDPVKIEERDQLILQRTNERDQLKQAIDALQSEGEQAQAAIDEQKAFARETLFAGPEELLARIGVMRMAERGIWSPQNPGGVTPGQFLAMSPENRRMFDEAMAGRHHIPRTPQQIQDEAGRVILAHKAPIDRLTSQINQLENQIAADMSQRQSDANYQFTNSIHIGLMKLSLQCDLLMQKLQ